MAKTPSLGVRMCFLALFAAGLGVEERAKGNTECAAVMGAVRGPSSKLRAKRATGRKRVGVAGGVESSSESSSVSERSSHMGKTSDDVFPLRARMWDTLGSDRERLGVDAELSLRGTGIAFEGVFAGVELEEARFGCLRRASLPEGREARVGMEAGRVGFERTSESSKNGSKGFELLDLYVGEDETSACEVGRGGDC